MQRRRVVKVGSTSSGWVPRVEQERHLAEVILGACRRLRVRIVISQRVINRRLQEQLVKAGILPLERISVRHVAAVVRLTGAQPLGSWRCEPDPQTASGHRGCVENAGTRESEWGGSVGVCGAINTIHVRGQKFTLICPPAPDTLVHRGCVVEKEVAQKCTPRGVATLLLCAPTEPEMRELDAVVQTAKTVWYVFTLIKNAERGARFSSFFTCLSSSSLWYMVGTMCFGTPTSWCWRQLSTNPRWLPAEGARRRCWPAISELEPVPWLVRQM